MKYNVITREIKTPTPIYNLLYNVYLWLILVYVKDNRINTCTTAIYLPSTELKTTEAKNGEGSMNWHLLEYVYV